MPVNRLTFREDLLKLVFPDGILPVNYMDLMLLMINIDEIDDLLDQIERHRTGVVESSPSEIKVKFGFPEVGGAEIEGSTKDIAAVMIELNKPSEPKMGRPVRPPGSLGEVCPKCGSDDVTIGGKDSEGNKRIRCKACGSQPTVKSELGNFPANFQEVPVDHLTDATKMISDSDKSKEHEKITYNDIDWTDEMDKRIQESHLSTLKLSEEFKAEGKVIPWQCINKRLRLIALPNCPYCGSKSVIRNGMRHNASEDKQKWECCGCKKHFVVLSKDQTNVAKEAARALWISGMSSRDISEKLERDEVCTVTHATICNWCIGIKPSKDIVFESPPKVEFVDASVPSPLANELDSRIMELYKTTNPKQISEILDTEGFDLTPLEITKRIKTIQLRDIVKRTGFTKSIDPQLPDKGRNWHDDKDLEKHVDLKDAQDVDDFGQQGIEAQGVEIVGDDS
jgi:transposase-like protein